MEIQKKFNIAIKTILQHEGGFVDRPSDRGGPTKYGISTAFLNKNHIVLPGDGVIEANEIKAITESQAIEIYKKYFWDKYQYDQIDSIDVATKVFDLAVNLGPEEGHKIAQRGVNSMINFCSSMIIFSTPLKEREQAKIVNKWPLLIVDGELGPKSIEAINEITKLGRIQAFIDWINWEAENVYHEIVMAHPDQEVNLNGWLERLKN